MRRKFKRIIAALLGAAILATPATAWADKKPGQTFCSTYHQVESNATGGSYVGGILMYETMGSVSRTERVTTTTSTSTLSGQLSVPQIASETSTETRTVSTTEAHSTTTTQEPIGFYQMNDGSVYEVNCLTGESSKVG